MTEHKITLDSLLSARDGTGHSIYGASGSPMYLACTGSLIPNILAPDDAGYDAAYGTVAHGVTEQWLRAGVRPDHLIGTRQFVGPDFEWHVIEIDAEMLEYAEQCVDRCEWEIGDHLIEHHVDFSHLTPIPNQGGTLDFAAMRKGRVITIDHKFGASPENIVYAEENPQLMLYTIGLWRDPLFQHYGFKDFIIRINQPRLRHFDEWHTTARRLAEFEDYCRERMREAWSFDAPRTPGVKQCRFCKVRSTCVANAALQEELMSGVFGDTTVQTAEAMQSFMHRLDDDLDPFTLNWQKVNVLSTAQLAKLVPYRSMAEAWWKAAAAELAHRAHDGEKIPGMKIVEGRSKRQFTNESKTREHLLSLGLAREQIISESLVSPAQAEKLLRRKGYRTNELPELLSGLVYKPPGRATLVPMSDRRPEVEDIGSVVFDDTTDNPETTESEDI